MPLFYKFTDKKNDKEVSLGEIDNLLCLDIGKAPSPDRYSKEFYILTEVGNVVYKYGVWK